MPDTTKVSEYEQRAVHCRDKATTAANSESKDYWLRAAEDWVKLAERALNGLGKENKTR